MTGMNPMRRRSFLAGTAGLAATGALAACGSSGSGGGGGEDGSQGGSTVTVWHYFAEDNQLELMDQYKEKFESENEGVTVENVFVPYDQINSKVVNAAGSQTGPDVVVFNGAEAAILALGGGLKAIDEEWAASEDADQFPDSVQHTIDGTLYAVQGYVNLLGLWCNMDKLNELGLEPPTTLDELEAAMAAAQEIDLAGITVSGLPQSQGEWQAYPWLSSQGFTYESPDEQALAEGFAMANGWVENGYLSKEATTWDQTVPFQQFLALPVAVRRERELADRAGGVRRDVRVRGRPPAGGRDRPGLPRRRGPGRRRLLPEPGAGLAVPDLHLLQRRGPAGRRRVRRFHPGA